MTFEEFVAECSARLQAGLVAAYGPDVGVEVAADAMAYAWENWSRLEGMENPVGYLYRVGQSSTRQHLKAPGYLPSRPAAHLPEFEPGLAPALEALSENQRICVILVHALGWSPTEAARLLDVDLSTVRTHLARGLIRLRASLKVSASAC